VSGFGLDFDSFLDFCCLLKYETDEGTAVLNF
jgi:hypothetical protein